MGRPVGWAKRSAAHHVFAFGLLLVAAAVAADLAIPPVARVTDQTGTLDPAQKSALEQKLAALEQAKGSQVAVLVVPTTAPETIEQYALRVAEAWKLGRKGVDDGILLLVAKDDHKLRIEVGYGLEGAVPDAIAKRVVAETITPKFREGDFAGGINAGVTQLIGVINGEALPPPPTHARRPIGVDFNTLMVVGFFIAVLSKALGRGIGEVPSALVAAGLAGVIGWFVFTVVIGAALAAVVMFVFSLILQLAKGGGGAGGFSTGGGSFGSGGGSFGGGGGFSGGGGSFGGGGASGSW